MDEFQFAWEASRVVQGQLWNHFDPVLLTKGVWSAYSGKVATYTQSKLGMSRIVLAVNTGRLFVVSASEGMSDEMQKCLASILPILEIRCPLIRYTYNKGRYIATRSLWI